MTQTVACERLSLPRASFHRGALLPRTEQLAAGVAPAHRCALPICSSAWIRSAALDRPPCAPRALPPPAAFPLPNYPPPLPPPFLCPSRPPVRGHPPGAPNSKAGARVAVISVGAVAAAAMATPPKRGRLEGRIRKVAVEGNIGEPGPCGGARRPPAPGFLRVFPRFQSGREAGGSQAGRVVRAGPLV